MAGYRCLTVWWTAAVNDRVWEALADFAAWPTWWRGIRSVEVLRDGDESGVGTVLRQRCRARLPDTAYQGRAASDLQIPSISDKNIGQHQIVGCHIPLT